VRVVDIPCDRKLGVLVVWCAHFTDRYVRCYQEMEVDVRTEREILDDFCKTFHEFYVGDDCTLLMKMHKMCFEAKCATALAQAKCTLRANSMSINEWVEQARVNSEAHGFHHGEENMSMREKLGGWLMNLHSEVSELWEAFRENKLFEPCDKAEKMKALGLPALTCLEEELADIVLRVFDDADALGVDLERAMLAKHAYNATRPYKHGGKQV